MFTDSAEIPKPITGYHTDMGLGLKGINDYIEMLEWLPKDIRNNKVFQSLNTPLVYTGAVPEVTLQEPNREDNNLKWYDYDKISNTVNLNSNYHAFHLEGSKAVSILNLEAGLRVMQNNKKYFEEAFKSGDPKWWLRQNHEQIVGLDGNSAQRGLLSGFPTNAVEKYEKFIYLKDRIKKSNLTEEETSFVTKEFDRRSVDSEGEDRDKKWEDIFQKSHITKKTEKILIKQAYEGTGLMHYYAFDSVDQEWSEGLAKLYEDIIEFHDLLASKKK